MEPLVDTSMSFGKMFQLCMEVKQRQDKLQDQVDKLQQANNDLLFCVLYPLAIRHMLVEAADLINRRSGSRHSSGVITPKEAAPAWAVTWLRTTRNTGLQTGDLTVIYVTVPGSIRGDANTVAHKISLYQQAAAVLAEPNEQRRASLARIFKFVHQIAVDDACRS